MGLFMNYDLLVLGGGPGGYTAAFRAADLGLKVVLVERYPSLGGVCLNVGCIPSKTLLHVSKVIGEVRDLTDYGIYYEGHHIDLAKLNSKKRSVIAQLSTGLASLAKQRKITLITGDGQFTGSNTLNVNLNQAPDIEVQFKNVIISTGSSSISLPDIPDDPRIVDSTGALELSDIPERLLIVGGGIIGLEMASVYAGLGSRVTIVELASDLMVDLDPDLVAPLEKSILKIVEAIFKGTRVSRIVSHKDSLSVDLDGPDVPSNMNFDKVLLAIGREPNTKGLGLEKLDVQLSHDGFVSVDSTMCAAPNVYAVGDIVGPPMLAHKAAHQGKVAAEAVAGLKAEFSSLTIPSVAYTDPELAWTGVTETEAKKAGIDFSKGMYPWYASGRSLSTGRKEGITKLLFDKKSRRLIGAGIVGSNAGELIGEISLAIEMGCDEEDLALTIHPHPTLTETISTAAEVAAGTVTELYLGRNKK